ncbi:hypothetical protein [Streptomyces sp. NPDC086782]|uniref:hypothetical protein n=1 Tax=Streptomyces sp. NPDC086782 TaxID=3365757 RepID=UPI0038076E9E
MSDCGCSRRCTCSVTAGSGVTVEGRGSKTNPYVISAGGGAAEPTALSVTDTPTVDLTLTGTGTTADPYNVTADVILDPAPPGGGSNLVHAGPDGLYVECADVRGCLSAGDGIAYDPVSGEIKARPSADAGNTVGFGADGGLYSAGGVGGAPTVVQARDTPTVDTTVSGTGSAGDPYVVSAAVILDPAPPGGGSNLAHAGPDGLYVECADVRGCLSAGDGIAYDPATGAIKARPSADAGNTVSIGADGGLYAPSGGGGGPATVATACGLTGDGSAASPLAAAVATWPFACPVDANGGDVYCDSAGALRTLPRGQASTVGDNRTTNFPNVRVPTGTALTVVHTENMTVTNPSACLPAYVIYEAEIDADFDLPAPVGGANGGAAALGFSTDELLYIENSGGQLIKDTHFQLSRTYWGGVIPPGGTATQTVAVTMGRGAGLATYDRIQVTTRAFLINL